MMDSFKWTMVGVGAVMIFPVVLVLLIANVFLTDDDATYRRWIDGRVQ